ncbi:CTQ-dependent lysine 6-oxidase LodA [Arcicella lustrica]|uniref:CTQ-dependent lysine 6-oxidase LodA n=1 Tax=Arcicella lustrica TaxID=2984196 RepID=A0ABU5SK76_9BACT|nr:CTQ-dependent lysine 6-oxidase LodA [Arcicella sp. DC25W]MEA5427708.1 CTQ-dependent lysine 6-oxidase LodA [Arcicella sp. DC25W]
MELKIHPSIGVARLGNSTTEICLSPDSIGGLPYDADNSGNLIGPISNFKDAKGLIKRQGQPFKIFQDDGQEITLDTPNVTSIEWTVHLANKKAAWYQYSELQGNLLYGNENSYENQNIPFRNPDITGSERQTLIIDPGPRTISGKLSSIGFDRENAPANYPVQYPNSEVKYGVAVTTLGDLLTDNSGRLVVLGGYGNAGGDLPLTSYGGSSTWHDDISDGPVYCTVTFNDGTPPVTLSAWVIVGSPDFAPEIVNISNLSDTMFDVGVRYFNLVSEMCIDGQYNPNYIANFQRDILPIINRISRYQWVANVQSMMAFASYQFDYSDPSEANKANRLNYAYYFRQNDGQPPVPPTLPQEQLFQTNGDNLFPMMPLNSGSNSVSNTNIMKFLALDQTQLFLLEQWANGYFVSDPSYQPYPVNQLDTASVGNCVGLPMCPGIEVTWSMQNPIVYASPYTILQYQDENWYLTNGLTPSRDECEGGGCEPGDLTKRMACPWQADFFQCTVQYINFTDPSVNKIKLPDGSSTPLPPTYYSYWWPPQSPWDVLVGELTEEGQVAGGGIPAGQQMNYARGINSFTQMVQYWYSLGFIRDKNSYNSGFPFMLETERNNEVFTLKEVPVSAISGNPEDAETTIPVFFIESSTSTVKRKSNKARVLMEHFEEVGFKAIEIHSEGLGLPRSGTRNRR